MEKENNDIKDLSKFFLDPSINIDDTAWKRDNADNWLIFLPLEPTNAPQDGFQRLGKQLIKISFIIDEVEGNLAFFDLVTKDEWLIGWEGLKQGKLIMSNNSGVAIFNRVPFTPDLLTP
ncbi:MAG: hypothetical protein K2Q21_10955 [Chitinophagaceae bacterium]|nr:hypothetical protein [Chitinophagaceae bacterium]